MEEGRGRRHRHRVQAESHNWPHVESKLPTAWKYLGSKSQQLTWKSQAMPPYLKSCMENIFNILDYLNNWLRSQQNTLAQIQSTVSCVMDIPLHLRALALAILRFLLPFILTRRINEYLQWHFYLCFLFIQSASLFNSAVLPLPCCPIYFSLSHLTCNISLMSTKRFKMGFLVLWRNSAPKSLSHCLGGDPL